MGGFLFFWGGFLSRGFFSLLREKIGLCNTRNSLVFSVLLDWPHFWFWELHFVDMSDRVSGDCVP